MAEQAWNIKCSWHEDLPDSPKQLDTGGYLLAPFRACLTNDTLEIELIIDVIDGTPDCTSYRVTPLDGAGLLYRTTEVTRGVKIRDLMAEALSLSVWEQQGEVAGLATSVELIEAVKGSVRRRREPMTDEKLREFASAYRQKFIPGKAAEFAESQGYSERQMYRRKKTAQERGFLTEGE